MLKAVDGVAIAAQMTVNEIVDMIKGEKGTAVVLTVLHPEALETEDISVIRDDILIPSVTHRVLDETDIGYIRLSRFSGESAGEVAEAISHLQELGAQRFVLDLRQNRGGLLEAAIAVSDHFLDGGPVLIQESNDDGTRTFEASMTTALPDAPLVVLVDGGSASASEIVAGALHDRGRATMIGSDRTFGKGSVQKVFDLSDGSSVHVTAARWFTPQRTKLDGEGLEPDILVEQTQEALDNGRDEVLNRAIQFLLDEGTAATQ